MKDVMVISITHHLPLLCPSGSEHKHHQSQHQTLHSLWGEQTRQNQASWLIVDYHETHCICCSLVFHVFSFFADLSILRLRVKGRSFWHSHTLWVWLRQTSMGGAVVIHEALSCFCFLHLLAGFAVRLTTTHPLSPSSSVCDRTTQDTEGSLHT